MSTAKKHTLLSLRSYILRQRRQKDFFVIQIMNVEVGTLFGKSPGVVITHYSVGDTKNTPTMW